MYDPKAHIFKKLEWNGQPAELVSIGLSPSYDPAGETVVIPYRMHDPVRHTLLKIYQYRLGQMEKVEIAYGPAVKDLLYPADDWAVLVAALNTLGLRLPEEVPRYFAAHETGEALYREWHKRIPEGMTFYLDQKYHEGLRNGMFFVWGNTVSPDGKHLKRAVGLEGTVSFTLHGNRKVMSEIEVREVPLLVQTPEQAIAIVRGLPEATGLAVFPPPVFHEGRWQVNIPMNASTTVSYMVDARPARVEQN